MFMMASYLYQGLLLKIGIKIIIQSTFLEKGVLTIFFPRDLRMTITMYRLFFRENLQNNTLIFQVTYKILNELLR